MRWFIALEALLFGSLFAGYLIVRARSDALSGPIGSFPWLETLLLVGASASFGAKRSQLVVTNTLSLTFVFIKALGDAALISRGITPSIDPWYFTLTGVLAIHVLGGAVFTGWLAGPSFAMAADDRDRWLWRIEATRRYWLFLDIMWLFMVAAFYF